MSIDNKFLRTFITLFKTPEAVINSYINGTRKKYIDALQYFAISITLAGIQVFLMNYFFNDAFEDVDFMKNINSSASQKNNPFKAINIKEINEYLGFAYIFTLPFSAFSTWLVYYILGDRRFNFTEHVVLNLYYSAQVIIVTAVLSIFF